MQTGSKVGRQRTQNIFQCWHIFIDSIEMPSVIPPPEAGTLWMSLPCLWGDPALRHPSQPTTVSVSMQRLKSPDLNRPLLDHSRLSVMWHLAGKKNLRGAADVFSSSSPPVFQKTFSFACIDMGIRTRQLYGPIHLHIHLPFDGFLSGRPKWCWLC